jgi:hypothetical protein
MAFSPLSEKYVSDPQTSRTIFLILTDFLERNWWIVSTGTPGGGQEATIINSLSTLTHHGIIYVSMGYKNTFGQLANMSEVCGGVFTFSCP